MGCVGSEKSSNGIVYYSVSRDSGRTVLRRYSEFLALQRKLEKQGLDACPALFPPRHSRQIGRCEKLATWLNHVLSANTDEILDDFFADEPMTFVVLGA